jgi:outer membrane protein assembly factor BamB
LASAGTIYVVQADGGLNAFSPDGSVVWQVPGQPNGRAISGPIVSPRTGMIYYALEGYMPAVTPDGQLAFRADIPYGYVSPLPRLDPTSQQVIFEDIMFNADTGEQITEPTFNPLDRFMIGANGTLYLQEETGVTEYQLGAETPEPPVTWNLGGFAFGFPTDSGVTNDGFVWLAFITGFQDTRIVWVDLKGNVLGTVIMPQRGSRIIGVDSNSTLYLCGPERGRVPKCAAYGKGQDEPTWEVELDNSAVAITGGALVPGRIYVAAGNGQLYAIGE